MMVELYWTAPSAGGAPIEGYKIETSSNNGATWTDSVADTENASGTPAGDNSTISGIQTYHAVDATGRKEPLPGVGNEHHRHGPGLCHGHRDPSGCSHAAERAANRGGKGGWPNEIEVTWTAPADPGIGPVTQYKIEYSKDGSLPWMELATVAGTAIKYENTGLASDTTRHYRVSAVNKAGRGPASDGSTVMATTDDAAADQMGTVTLSTQEPMVDRAITATLEDADGMVSGQMWQWQKSMNKASWMAATGTGAMTSSYTPAAMDEGYYGGRMVTYTDKNRSDRIAQSMATDAVTLPPDQEGMVTLSTQEPMVGTAITATLTDADGMVSGQMWQWQKSMDKTSWMAATGAGAMTMSYTPAEMDEGYYLRATVTYTDKNRSGRMADSMATTDAVTDELSDEARLLDGYDTNDDNRIGDDELGNAIIDYTNGDLSPSDMGTIILLFLR